MDFNIILFFLLEHFIIYCGRTLKWLIRNRDNRRIWIGTLLLSVAGFCLYMYRDNQDKDKQILNLQKQVHSQEGQPYAVSTRLPVKLSKTTIHHCHIEPNVYYCHQNNNNVQPLTEDNLSQHNSIISQQTQNDHQEQSYIYQEQIPQQNWIYNPYQQAYSMFANAQHTNPNNDYSNQDYQDENIGLFTFPTIHNQAINPNSNRIHNIARDVSANFLNEEQNNDNQSDLDNQI